MPPLSCQSLFFRFWWIQTTPRAEEICSCGAMTYQASTKHLCFEKKIHMSNEVHPRCITGKCLKERIQDGNLLVVALNMHWIRMNSDEVGGSWRILKDLGLLRLGHFGNKSMESGIFQWGPIVGRPTLILKTHCKKWMRLGKYATKQ